MPVQFLFQILIFKRRDQGSKVKEATTWFILLIEYRLLLLLCDVLTLVTVGLGPQTSSYLYWKYGLGIGKISIGVDVVPGGHLYISLGMAETATDSTAHY